MKDLCDLQVHINGEHTFLVHQRVLCSFSGKLKKMVKQERRRCHARVSGLKIMDFPGGPEGFELVSRFCYNSGRITMSPANVSVLHCGAIFLEMTEEFSTCNLLRQTDTFLDDLFYWTWGDILRALKICELFFSIADSCGLILKLITSLLSKISANSQVPLTLATSLPSSSSSCSSPETSGLRCSSSSKTLESMKTCFTKEWWFDDLTLLGPNIVEKFMRILGAYGDGNKNLILTRFLLYYLKEAVKNPSLDRLQYGGLADTAVHGVVRMGRSAFSCRGLFWVLRLVSGLGLSKECRYKLERLMGLMLDQATLDDLLVSGYDGVVYDVNLVLRLVRVFVSEGEGEMSLQRMKKVGRLVDKYLGEISPDQSLKVCKFLGVAESLPDSARDCFDGVYRALDIYLESHPKLNIEECMRLCQCLNYEKLTLEACKDLAKNKRIPPGVAIHALAAQKSKLQIKTIMAESDRLETAAPQRLVMRPAGAVAKRTSVELLDEKDELRLNLQRMQNKVIELEKVCREMKGQMSKMVNTKGIHSTCHYSSRGMPRFC